jgi:hypothetical protein
MVLDCERKQFKVNSDDAVPPPKDATFPCDPADLDAIAAVQEIGFNVRLAGLILAIFCMPLVWYFLRDRIRAVASRPNAT